MGNSCGFGCGVKGAAELRDVDTTQERGETIKPLYLRGGSIPKVSSAISQGVVIAVEPLAS